MKTLNPRRPTVYRIGSSQAPFGSLHSAAVCAAIRDKGNVTMKKGKNATLFNFSFITILFLAGTLLMIVLNTVCRIWLIQAAADRYNLTVSANQFMDASAYLTNEVRAYVATGNREHYNNYWNEVDVERNREESVAALEKIGITAEEQALIDQMSDLSDALVPLESKAMDMVGNGDPAGALEIVYGKYYNDSVTEIRSLRDSFSRVLNERTSDSIRRAELIFNVINLLTWIMVGGTIVLQIFQKRGLHRMAYQDALTGGDNYSSFREKMRNGTVSGAGYVISADLRGFGIINNTCGIAKGDELIHAMGEILAHDLRRGELSAHVSGDKFVMFLHSPSQRDLVNRVAALRRSIIDLSPQLSIPHIMPQFGIRPVDTPKNPERSYSDANLAKQMIKERTNYYYLIFDEKMRDRELEIQEMEDSFGPALEDRQFEMWYQPKYDPVSGEPVAAEALVRWRKPDGTLISPGKFIPLFESNGMIAQLDEYTLDTVCRQQRAWLDAGKKLVPVSVNVSRASLFFDDIAARYMVLVRRYDLPADCIELEITESAMNENENVDGILDQFHICGFHLLVDDFGSGYSSLSTLTKRRFDNIKIDKSLVDCIGQMEGDLLLESIVHMAHEFKMTITAEGVEKDYQVDFLKKQSCDNIQGFYYSRPLPAPDFDALLNPAVA